MKSNSSLAGQGEITLESNNIILGTLGPWVESTLLAQLGKDWLAIVNSYRKNKLIPRPDGSIPWDVPALLGAMLDCWPNIREAIEKRCRASDINPREIKTSINLARDLRHRAAHSPKFGLKDRNRFLDLMEHVLRVAGLDQAANRLDSAPERLSLPTIRQQINALAPDRERFWELVRVAYQRMREKYPGTFPPSLDTLINESTFPSELPLQKHEHIIDWVPHASVLKNNRLWAFVTEIYPAKTADDVQPPSTLLSGVDFTSFDIARRNLAKAYDVIGNAFLEEGWGAERLPVLSTQETLMKLSTYLALALAMRGMNRGPDK
jgi:hypothetical protein